MKRIILSLMLVMFLVSFASAVTLDSGTVLNTTGSNSSMTFNTVTVTVDQATVTEYNVSLYNTTYTNGELTVDFTTTIDWKTVNDNVDSSEFPYLSTTTATTKTITSTELDQTLTGTVIVGTHSQWGNGCEQITKVTYSPASSAPSTFEGGTARTVCKALIGSGYTLSIEDGANTLTFEFGTTSLTTRIMYILVGFLAIAALLFAAVGILKYAREDFSSIDVMGFVKYSILLLLFVILMIVLMNYIVSVV